MLNTSKVFVLFQKIQECLIKIRIWIKLFWNKRNIIYLIIIINLMMNLYIQQSNLDFLLIRNPGIDNVYHY